MTANAHTTPRSVPALLLGETSDSWGDERERSVMLEAYAYVFVLATIILWTVAAVIAWFVPWWVTVVLFVALLVPSMEWQRYCKARGVDASALAYGGTSWVRTAVTGLYFGLCAVSMAVAVTAELSPGNGSGSGGIIGGVCGALGAIAFGRWTAKRKTQRVIDDDDA